MASLIAAFYFIRVSHGRLRKLGLRCS